MEPKSKKKRVRSENWLEEDKNLLMELIKDRVKIIENKNTDTNTNTKKKKAWDDVHESFNCLCKGGTRNLVQIKSQWGQIKLNKRKDVHQLRKDTIKTGGGGPPAQPPDDPNDITAWLPHEFAVDTNLYDSDQVVVMNNTETSPIKEDKTFDISDNLVMNNTETSPIKKDKPFDISDNLVMNNTETSPIKKDKPFDISDNLITIEEVDEEIEIEMKELDVDEQPNKVKKQIKNSKENKIRNEKPKAPIKDYAYLKIKEVAETENNLKKELHIAQMANEARKAMNLELKREVLQAKLMYYKNKIE